MKREYSNLHPQPPPSDPSTAAISQGKAWEVEEANDGGMDELLAVLGYKVRSSDMAKVASKLEQLEEVMGLGGGSEQQQSCQLQQQQQQENGVNDAVFLSHLSNDTVHFNPADISSWLESMLSELNNPPVDNSFFASSSSSNSQISTVDFDNDLKAIPGTAVLQPDPKRLKPTALPPQTQTAELTRPVLLVDSQENGVRLVHLLLACAEAVEQNNLTLAEALVKQIGYLAVSQAGAMRKVATYFAEALARRIYRVYPQNTIDHSLSDILQLHFYESCPYLKFAHFTANQSILEAFEGKKRVHVIDFSMNQGMQWPVLMQALALRPGGPPAFRLTGIGPPSSDNTDYLQEVGWKLAQLAETIHVEFEYRGFVASSLADLDSSMLELRPSESVAVNSVFELHKLLARPGAIEKVLNVIKEMKPEIVTVVEQEANHNGSSFLDRFTESLHYYSTLFDSLEGSVSAQDKVMSEVYLGKQICNVVACEGTDRVERHETLTQWRTLFESAGFVPAHIGSNAFKQAGMLLAYFAGGDGYRVEENNGCLMLGWHTRPLIATSAWKLEGNSVVTQ